MPEKLRKKLFYLAIVVNFLMVTVYEFLTPNMSDDIIYSDEVAKAGSFFGLFAQEYDHYMHHIGRSVAHIILRIFLYIGNKGVFNVVAAAVFVAISLLIYVNVDKRKAYDLRVYLGIMILFWLFEPTISNSVLWETGACNYMFTALIMAGFITFFRKKLHSDKNEGIGLVILMFLFGILAGWCNENSSGGVILFVLIMIFAKWRENKNFSAVRSWMISGLIGNILGLIVMILSPGNSSRAASADESHTGLLALMARFLKITLNIKNHYLVLVFAFIVILIAIAYRTGDVKKFWEASRGMILCGFLFLATCYALIAVPDSQLRTYYGASLFLMTGIMQGFAWILNEGFKEDLLQIIGTSLVTLFAIFLAFTYLEEGANLARIKREWDEREAYFYRMVEEDTLWINAPKLRPDWQTVYSMAYDSDISEDKDYWLNISYCFHYGLDFIEAVEREDWTEY